MFRQLKMHFSKPGCLRVFQGFPQRISLTRHITLASVHPRRQQQRAHSALSIAGLRVRRSMREARRLAMVPVALCHLRVTQPVATIFMQP
jgi:hypothetical protein